MNARRMQRDRFVAVAKLRRIAAGFEIAHATTSADHLEIEIDGDCGKLVEHGGEGNHVCAFWNATGVVAIEFIHDIPEAHDNPTPARHLEEAPSELADLVAAACSFGPKLATNAAWAVREEDGGEWPEMLMLEAHTWPPEDALEMVSSLGPNVHDLIERAERATRSGTYTMTEADTDAVLGKSALEPRNVEKAVKWLERANVIWPGAVERTAALAEELANAPPKLKHSKAELLASKQAIAMMPGQLERDRFVEVARLLRIIQAFEGVHGGPLDELDVEDDGDTGSLVARGNKQVVTAVWNATDVVGLAFDAPAKAKKPKKAKAPPASKPGVLDHLPPALAELAAAAQKLGDGALVDAVWARGKEGSRPCPLGIPRLEVFTFEPARVVGIATYAMIPERAALIHKLEKATRAGPYTMTDQDTAAVLAIRSRPHPANVGPAIAVLERAGVLWPGFLARVQEEHDAVVAARKLAQAPPQRDLLRAAMEGDFPAVRAALEAGAVIDCQTYDKMFERNVVGATALWFALRKGHVEMAEHLIVAGADVNRWANGCPGPAKCGTPLRLAASLGDPKLVRLLLERGATVVRGEPHWAELRALADSSGTPGSATDRVEILRLLLDAGAELPQPNCCDALRKLADAGGAPELIERLGPAK